MPATAGTIVITGASKGIGAATALAAAKAGYAVAINYSSSDQAAATVLERIRKTGGEAITVKGDVSDEAFVKELFDRTENDLGPITAVFNNAGITGPVTPLAELSLDDLRRVFEINVFGVFLTAREAVRRMSTGRGGKGGSIVNMSSRAGQLGGGGEWLHYGASKGALDSFTVGLAREVGAEGIRVNAVAPGLIETEIHARAGDGKRLERLLPGVPMGRTGTAEEVADTVLWLLGEQSSYVSGAIVPISGGR